jgi:hypothetical protein
MWQSRAVITRRVEALSAACNDANIGRARKCTVLGRPGREQM